MARWSVDCTSCTETITGYMFSPVRVDAGAGQRRERHSAARVGGYFFSFNGSLIVMRRPGRGACAEEIMILSSHITRRRTTTAARLSPLAAPGSPPFFDGTVPARAYRRHGDNLNSRLIQVAQSFFCLFFASTVTTRKRNSMLLACFGLNDKNRKSLAAWNSDKTKMRLLRTSCFSLGAAHSMNHIKRINHV